VLSEASHLHNLLHQFTFYDKIHIVLLFVFFFVINWNMTFLLNGWQEAFASKSVVWEHLEEPSVSKCSVAV